MADAHAHDEHGDNYHVHAHIAPLRTYYIIFGLLIALTGLTVLAYNVRLGEWNLLVAVIIAAFKSSLVVTWFMHMKHEKMFNGLFFFGSFIFMGIFLFYTLNDTNYRGQVSEYNGGRVDGSNGQYAYGTAASLSEQGGEELALGLAMAQAPFENSIYDLWFERNADGVVCRGRVSSEEEKARLLALVQEKTGVEPVDRLTVHEGTAPVNWSAAADIVSTTLGHLEAGYVKLTGNAVRARGYTDSAKHAQITELLATLPDIGYRPEANAVQDSIGGTACEQELATRMRGRSIGFATGSAQIQPSSYALVSRLAQAARRCPTAVIEVSGHTDNVGDPVSNRILSRRRAGAVKNALARRGVARSRLTAAGYGESQPTAANDTDEGRAANRRIEFHLAR